MPIAGSFFLEFSTHFDQVAGEGDNVLCLLYHVQIDHAHLDADRLALDALQLLPVEVRELHIEAVSLLQLLLHALVTAAFYPLAARLQQVEDILRYVPELLLLSSI